MVRDLSSTTRLAQNLLYNRGRGERSRPLPVVVLLGPVGAGKTHALKTLSRDCGAGVVHAFFDFDRLHAADRDQREPATVEVLAQLAFWLSRKWRARRSVRFTRFTLGMVAVQTSLDGLTREQATERLRRAIDGFAGRPRIADAVNGLIGPLADVMSQTDLVGDSIAETIRTVLPDLVRTVARRRLGRAMRFHAGVDDAEGAEPIDALIKLSTSDTNEMTDWLTDAFLADVRASYLRTAGPDMYNPCACEHPRSRRHLHNWVLMLDNIDHPTGRAFVSDLLAARDRHLRHQPDDHDPLLLVATSGWWDREWESDWQPPWRAGQAPRNHAWTVPTCRAASYGQWIEKRSRYYPVLLEPLTIDETARLVGVTRHDPACVLAHRASGGLPTAVNVVAPLVREPKPAQGARDVLASDGAASDPNPWRTRLANVGLIRRTPGNSPTDMDELISAAPFATAPWLVPAEATSVVTHPRLGRILTELRTALWVTAPTGGGATADYAELHPWLAGTLVSALAERATGPGLPSFTDQFTALLEDPDTAEDPARKAYCQLALGQFGAVVSGFTTSFDTEPHLAWNNRLRLVTRAPDNLSLTRRGAELYDELVNEHITTTPPERPPIGNIVTRLVVAKWLAANPFAMPDQTLRDVITDAYQDLRGQSRRPDVGDLHD